MAVKIEKGGWILIFLIGLGLVGYSLDRYGVFNLRGRFASRSDATGEKLDPSKPLVLPVAAAADASCSNVRVRVGVGAGHENATRHAEAAPRDTPAQRLQDVWSRMRSAWLRLPE